VRPTITDVAKRAGVSHTTVSWVIHDDPRITARTKEKVQKAIKELDYHPNINARSLVRGKTNTVAVVTSFFSSYFEMTILKGMEQCEDPALKAYQINLYSTRCDEESKIRILKEILYGKRADAVILLALGAPEELLQEFSKLKMPLVLVEAYSPLAHVVKMDNIVGGSLGAEQLWKAGCRNPALVAGIPQPVEGDSAEDRRKGFEDFLSAKGEPFREERLYLLKDYYVEEGERAYRTLMDKDPAIDGIFCAAGDEVSFGIMRAALADGRKIPQDLKIIGYDDIPSASLVSPALSTIGQPIEVMGLEALRMAVEALKNPEPFQRIILQPQPVLRESCS